jgi:hypothetical protein
VLSAIEKAMEPYTSGGLVTYEGGRLRLQDPEGFLRSNDVISSIFAELGKEGGRKLHDG